MAKTGREREVRGGATNLRRRRREPEVSGDGEGLRHATEPLARLRLRRRHRLAGRRRADGGEMGAVFGGQMELAIFEPRRFGCCPCPCVYFIFLISPFLV
jgi:hypothetical protein